MGKGSSFKELRKKASELPEVKGVNHYSRMKNLYVTKGVEAVKDYYWEQSKNNRNETTLATLPSTT